MMRDIPWETCPQYWLLTQEICLPASVISQMINNVEISVFNIDGLVQDCSNSSELALELLQSCTEPSIYV